MSSFEGNYIMDRCLPKSSLPQNFLKLAKPNLVKATHSDGENNQLTHDHNFQSKKRRINGLSISSQELYFKGESFVVPSFEGKVKRKITRVPSQDDLWKSIQTNYSYLMADDLIAECQETKKELYLPPTMPAFSKPSSYKAPSNHIITFKEFLDQFNKLHDTLHSLQTSSSHPEISVNQSNEMYVECQSLKEQASILRLMNPELEDDISRRCNILSNKMNIVERILFPQKVSEKDEKIKALTVQMKEIRKWLIEVEKKLRKLRINDDWATEDMKDVFDQEKILQREIEGRGKELTSIVRDCDLLEGATVAESKKLRRAAAHLERSWHNIWIRSLEKQCLTEQRLLQRQSYENKRQEVSDLDLDDGPLNKHRRLTLDRWTAVAATTGMDKTKRERDARRTGDFNKSSSPSTKDVGVHCNEMVPVNDKCIMVGTTGIAALKAEYGDDFTNFEIIQDVGYSSESSTHLSSDDSISVGRNRYFNIRIYNYTNNIIKTDSTKCMSLKEELENADGKQPESLSSSLGSSSGVASLNDSGLGSADIPVVGNSAACVLEDSIFGGVGEDSDYLETVLESCPNFCVSDGEGLGTQEELQYRLSGIESDDSVDNFQNKSSFTTSSQLFYKMTSVDSDNDVAETRGDESRQKPLPKFETSKTFDIPSTLSKDSIRDGYKNADSDFFTFQPSFEFRNRSFSSPPPSDLKPSHYSTPNLKRKRDYDSNTDYTPIGRTPHRVQSWLKRCSNYHDTLSLNRVKRSLFQSNSDDLSSCDDSAHTPLSFKTFEDVSSCDASGEYTSSSADEDNAFSHSSLNNALRDTKPMLDSCSGGGSVETVVRRLCTKPSSDNDWVEVPPLLPPPLTSTPSCLKNGHCKTNSLRCCNGSLSSHSCRDLRWMVLKASSEGDLRRNLTESEQSLFNSPIEKRQKKRLSPFHFKNRLCSSLPNVLRHRSESSAAEDIKEPIVSDNSKHEDSLTSVVSHNNQSSSSDAERKKKRRSRRKSSCSSNRSSRSILNSSGDSSGHHRSRTLTSITVNSRRRHFSQRSDFHEASENNLVSEDDAPFSGVHKLPPTEEVNHKTLKAELELALNEESRKSAILLSPVESDVVLTQLEEQSTVSDQVWDGYQDMPYLSEAYSEATADEEAVRKLTEFGDDYGSAIGRPPSFLGTSGGSKIKTELPKSSPKKSVKTFQALSESSDSDSDLEDLHHVMEEAAKALQFARSTLKRRQSGDFFSSSENSELLATCGTHLHCLQTICDHIQSDGIEKNFSSCDLEELYYLVQEWENLKKSIEMFEEAGENANQRYLNARKTIDDLFNKLSELSSATEMETTELKSWDDLQDKISHLQTVLSTLQDTKEQLLAVNLQVHRFMTEYGSDQKHKDCLLKEDVTELYQKWEDTYEKSCSRLTEFETLSAKLKSYEDKFRALSLKVKEIESTTTKEYCDINCDDQFYFNLQGKVKELSSEAEHLRSSSLDEDYWKTIQSDLTKLKKRIKRQSRIYSASRNENHPNSSSVEDDPDDHFEDAVQQIENHPTHTNHMYPSHLKSDAKKDAINAEKKSSRFWRTIRVAVPVQLTLVLLFCLACYLEPNCCDRLNNYNFSFTPHLRYLRGPPPV